METGHGWGCGFGEGFGEGAGFGDGAGDGFGADPGHGNGAGFGHGYSFGFGDGDSDGFGCGAGYGEGFGCGYGNGAGLGLGLGLGEGGVMEQTTTMKTIILCATEKGRAIVIGRVESDPVPGQPVTLHDARMVLEWSNECGGLFGLAAGGPKEGTRITRAVPVVVETVWQEWLLMTEEAAAAVDAWPVC